MASVSAALSAYQKFFNSTEDYWKVSLNLEFRKSLRCFTHSAIFQTMARFLCVGRWIGVDKPGVLRFCNGQTSVFCSNFASSGFILFARFLFRLLLSSAERTVSLWLGTSVFPLQCSCVVSLMNRRRREEKEGLWLIKHASFSPNDQRTKYRRTSCVVFDPSFFVVLALRWFVDDFVGGFPPKPGYRFPDVSVVDSSNPLNATKNSLDFHF